MNSSDSVMLVFIMQPKAVAVLITAVFLAPMVQGPPVDVNDDVVVIEPTCEALPAVEGDTVAVTCDFGVDVSHQHLWSSIGVELKPSSGGAVLDVLECFWLPGEAADCSAWPGYSYDGRLGRTVDVTIPNASLAHTGTYSCHIIPADGALLTVQMSQQCVFILKDSPARSESGRPAEGERTTDAPTESGNKKIWPVVLGVVLGVITTVAVVVVLAFFRRRLLPDTGSQRKRLYIDDKSDVNREPWDEDKDTLKSGGGDDDSDNEYQDCAENIAAFTPVAEVYVISETNCKEDDSSDRSLYEDCQENTDVLSPVAKDPSISEKNWEENDSSDRSLVAHPSSKKQKTQVDDDDGTNSVRTMAPEGQETVPSHTDTKHTATEEEMYRHGNSSKKCEDGVDTTDQRTAGDGEEADVIKKNSTPPTGVSVKELRKRFEN